MIPKVMRYAYMGLFLVPGIMCAAPLRDRLEKAIEETDLIEAEGLLKELKLTGSIQEKTDILTDMSLMARDVRSNLKADKSLVNNMTDFTQASLGSLVGLVSAHWLIAIAYSQIQQSREWRNMSLWAKSLFTGAPALGTVLGGYYAYKGLTCATQNKRIVRSGKIKKMIQGEQEGLAQVTAGKK